MGSKTYTAAELRYLAEREAAELQELRAQGEEPGGPYVRSKRPAGKTKMTVIYSVRFADQWVERLRKVAEAEGIPPSTLLRKWAEEHLEQVEQGELEPDPRVQRAVRLELERAGLVRQAS